MIETFSHYFFCGVMRETAYYDINALVYYLNNCWVGMIV